LDSTIVESSRLSYERIIGASLGYAPTCAIVSAETSAHRLDDAKGATRSQSDSIYSKVMNECDNEKT